MSFLRGQRIGLNLGATALALGLTIIAQSAAFAAPRSVEDAPAVTASPTTDLKDGDVTRVSVGGFGSNQGVTVLQCGGASSPNGVACNVTDAQAITTDETGNGSITFVVRAKFTGVDQGGNSRAIDCTTGTDGCIIAGVLTADPRVSAGTSISFSSAG